MTAKEYLSQLRHIRGRIKAKEEKIIELEARLFSCVSVITGMPNGLNRSY